ncbi:uncharacterized protein A4U43_C04F26570 [Asparagus officinalis]|uniref:Uncharacterized protein n=1 Tax=Asparagus officinalis TaxID=4686 RepID=A0A5P1F3V8_ASPOF|nr:uncharacterized protein A4U43_C04F26570 [Asparagus officinalis]
MATIWGSCNINLSQPPFTSINGVEGFMPYPSGSQPHVSFVSMLNNVNLWFSNSYHSPCDGNPLSPTIESDKELHMINLLSLTLQQGEKEREGAPSISPDDSPIFSSTKAQNSEVNKQAAVAASASFPLQVKGKQVILEQEGPSRPPPLQAQLSSEQPPDLSSNLIQVVFQGIHIKITKDSWDILSAAFP